MDYQLREAGLGDIAAITKIYNEGIEDRTATLETRLRSENEMKDWFLTRSERYRVVVITDAQGIVRGWASINVFNSRCCYDGVGDLSIYIERAFRGRGFGKPLLNYLLKTAAQRNFHKIVLSTFENNLAGKALYHSVGFREVGTYMKQGKLDGAFINITIMEKLL